MPHSPRMVPSRKPAIAFIFITLVLDILGIGLIIPILPKLIEEMQGKGLDSAAYTFGVLFALYSLMQFLFAPLLGSLSDRYGRRPVILISLFGSGVDYFFLAFAPTIGWFFLARMISGVTGANFAPASAYIADVSPPEKRAANFGLIGAAFGLGFVIGPAIGGVLGEIDLRLPFIAAGCLTLINWLYGVFVLPESLKPEKPSLVQLEARQPNQVAARPAPLPHGVWPCRIPLSRQPRSPGPAGVLGALHRVPLRLECLRCGMVTCSCRSHVSGGTGRPDPRDHSQDRREKGRSARLQHQRHLLCSLRTRS